jgi:hypothetical protein
MTVNFNQLFPALQPALEGIARSSLIQQVNETQWVFAVVEIGHLLFLAMLGGAVFALNLRLLDLVLKDVPVEQVEQAARPWYWLGAAGTVVTGLAMSITTLRTLLPNGAFFIKMVALLAAILLSHFVARLARQRSPEALRASLPIIAAGFAIWLLALFLFTTTASLNSGSLLVALVAAVLLAALAQPRHRAAVAALATLGLVGWYMSLDVFAGQPGGDTFAWVGNGLAGAAVALPIGIGVRDVRTKTINGERYLKVTAYASTLAWITVAAAGRWIGFS